MEIRPMSCAILLAATLVMADPTSAAQPPAEAGAALATEPLFAEIVNRSRQLKSVVDGWIAEGAAADSAFTQRPDFATFSADIEALAALDLRGHVELRERNSDGDLRCILRGLSADIPRKLEALAIATEPRARGEAMGDLAYLLDDNAAVVLAPPQPAG